MNVLRIDFCDGLIIANINTNNVIEFITNVKISFEKITDNTIKNVPIISVFFLPNNTPVVITLAFLSLGISGTVVAR